MVIPELEDQDESGTKLSRAITPALTLSVHQVSIP
jgi:hypothetical protein